MDVTKFKTSQRNGKATVLSLTVPGRQLTGPLDFYCEVQAFEIQLIEWALKVTKGNQTSAAELLGIKPKTLHMLAD